MGSVEISDSDLPTYAELEARTKGHPLEGHAWDVWNKPGSKEKDNLGGKYSSAHYLA